MLKKLLHYDLKWCFKVVVIYYGLSLLFSCFGRLLDFMPDTFFWGLIAGITKGIGVGLAVSGFVNSFIRMWVRMSVSMYKDESYLMHTLPVDIRTHFLSKFIATIIMICSSIIVILVCVVISYGTKENFEGFIETLNILSNNFEGSFAIFVALMVLVLMTEFIYMVMMGFFGIVIGHRSDTKRALKSVFISVGAYMATNTVTGVILLIGSIVSTDLYGILFKQQEAVGYTFICTLMVFAILLYSAYTAILYWLTVKNLQKGVNID